MQVESIEQAVADLVESFDKEWHEEKFDCHVNSDLSGVAHADWFSIHLYATEAS